MAKGMHAAGAGPTRRPSTRSRARARPLHAHNSMPPHVALGALVGAVPCGARLGSAMRRQAFGCLLASVVSRRVRNANFFGAVRSAATYRIKTRFGASQAARCARSTHFFSDLQTPCVLHEPSKNLQGASDLGMLQRLPSPCLRGPRRTRLGACLSVIAWCSTVSRASGWAPCFLPHALPRQAAPGRRGDGLGRPARAEGAMASLAVQADAGHESKRAKRRRRAPPSDLQQWMTALSENTGGLKLLLDLDNNADAVPQLEAAQVPNLAAALYRRLMRLHAQLSARIIAPNGPPLRDVAGGGPARGV
jgi:hypothetical protein